MTKFEIGWYDAITPIKVEKESEHCVWVEGQRRRKVTDYCRIFDTWEEAHAFLLSRQESIIRNAEEKIAFARGCIQKINKLKPQ